MQLKQRGTSALSQKMKWIMAFGVLAICLQIIFSYRYYFELKDTLTGDRNYQRQLIEENILSSVSNADTAYQIIEQIIHDKMARYSQVMLEKYRAEPDVLQWDLEALKKQFENFDIYIIDTNHTIVHTTDRRQLGLDFKTSYQPGFITMLNERIQGNKFHSDRFIISLVKETRKFGYMPTPDHRYLFELGVNVNDFTNRMQQLDLTGLAYQVVEPYPSVSQATIYSLKADSQIRGPLSHYSRNHHPANSPTQLELARKAILNNQTQEFSTWDPVERTTLTYRYIPFITSAPTGQPDYYNSRLIEIVHNNHSLEMALQAQRIRVGVGLVIVAAVLITWLITMYYLFEKLDQARQAAERANRAKSDFLSTISHEIRSPLNGIVGTTELLLTSTLTPAQQQKTMIIRNSVDMVLKIINDILDLSKIEAGYMSLQPVPMHLHDVMQNINEMVKPRIAEGQLQYQCTIAADVPPYVIGDNLRIKQILLNLISNAITFTETGEINVTVTCEPHRTPSGDPYIRFAVQDTGIGISPEEQSRLFQPFSQADHVTFRKYGGTGLGLSICKQLTKLMEGTIGVTSQPGLGSTFWVILPLPETTAIPSDIIATTAAQAPKDLAATNSSALNHTAKSCVVDIPVLIVDDSKPNRQVLRMQLESLGFTSIDEAANGRIAQRLASQKQYTLLLMDCLMPILDGYDTTQAIRAQEALTGHRSRIIAITASNTRQDHERCLFCGMDDIIVKPILLQTLCETLAYWLSPTALPQGTSVTPPIDRYAMALINQIAPDDKTAMELLFHRFTSEAPEQFATLQAAIGNNNVPLIAATAGQWKSQCAAIGALRLYRLCHDLALVARTVGHDGSGDSHFTSQAQAIEAELQQVLDYLHRSSAP
ncbi:sensor histidine kinase [Heliophilum fasciatum]|uniref:Circadian input-output histidine kinase CikA n=1 Tax=Heliophilum fasciatum TaxID=35700 RepID=A0A4R2RPK2_9FIRM|nr:sensor histidine kinase [Heliophilum fasciatum]MCW2277630.1 signal transduction histidine kinase/CheY-like chemotaxis protein [Heliophilum fasciatum]TCP64978.1 signal transduction histidine kinase [Heliophilum fasciatum]